MSLFCNDILYHTLYFLYFNNSGEPLEECKKMLNVRLVSKEWRDTIDRIFPYSKCDALLLSCKKEKKESLKFVLKNLVNDFNQGVPNGFPPTVEAIKKDNSELVSMLLEDERMFPKGTNVALLLDECILNNCYYSSRILLKIVEERQLTIQVDGNVDGLSWKIEQRHFHTLKDVIHEHNLENLVSKKTFEYYDRALDAVYRILRKPLKKI